MESSSRSPFQLGLWEWLAGAALIVVFSWKLAFTNLILARGDTFLYFYPLWDYRAGAFLAGRLPLWAPELFMGAPFLANSQTGVLYPFNWPLVIFPAPIAVKIAILAHLWIALAGAQIFARRRLGLSPWAALLSAMVFALGGYLTAQVEHINQLQALAWFPWLLLGLEARSWRWKVGRAAMVIALQVLAGHTQSVFLSLSGAALYMAVLHFPSRPGFDFRPLAYHLGALLGAVGLAALLAAAQLIPTFELSRESLRGGGLPWREALSFSLDPRLLGRTLLPGYSHSLFTEFIGYPGVLGLALAACGVSRSRRNMCLLILAGVGLAFALGAYNPLSAALATLPPFNLFRVPARWLFLFAFGIAMLAGLGLDALQRPEPARYWKLGLALLPVVLAPLANGLTPAGETGALGAPALVDLAGWLLPLALLGLALAIPNFLNGRAPGLLTLAALELFAASLALPFNRLTAPEAYTSIRPAMTQLLAVRRSPVADRFLSMSALRFDPGDLAELHSALDSQLPRDEVDDFVVATKHKEVLSPNLPLTWGVPAVDGFDGGILPLKHYAEFTSLFTGVLSADGRLRENVTQTPDPRLLALVNARWLITDKVADSWIDGVFYDLGFTVTLTAGEALDVARVPAFQGTGLGIVTDAATGSVQVEFDDHSVMDLPILGGRVRFDRPGTPTRITLLGPLIVRGLSLIDERTGAFQSLTLGPYRLVHSGDVKVYENLDVLPRAFVAPAAIVEDDEAARSALAEAGFDPAATAILSSAPAQAPGAARSPSSAMIIAYAPEHVRLTAVGPGTLVLTDAFYPGWEATVDGQPVPILRADLMFRAVELSAGTHTVEFRFAPASVVFGVALSGAGVAVLVVLALSAGIKRPKRDTSAPS